MTNYHDEIRRIQEETRKIIQIRKEIEALGKETEDKRLILRAEEIINGT